MFRRASLIRTLEFVLLLALSPIASAQILRVADLNTAQLRALDREKTVVLLPGGIVEEHGPYLPAYADGILSERLTQEIARAIAAKKPGWTVLIFPQVALGASGSNELGTRLFSTAQRKVAKTPTASTKPAAPRHLH